MGTVGQITNGMVKEGGTYKLKMQSKYNSQIVKGKRIKNIQPKDVEQVQWVRL